MRTGQGWEGASVVPLAAVGATTVATSATLTAATARTATVVTAETATAVNVLNYDGDGG